MGFKGINIRQSGDRIILREALKDSSGMPVTGGSTAVRLYEVQSDGSVKSYDWNDNTFKTGALTTATVNATNVLGNNNTYNAGLWTYVLSTVSGFTLGGIYFYSFSNPGATPPETVREFQYGSAEGDLTTTAGSTGVAYLQTDEIRIAGSATAGTNLANAYAAFETGTAQAGGASSITLRAGASAVTDFYKNQAVFILSGTGAPQTNSISAYDGTTKVATVVTAWATQPDNTSVYLVLGRT